MHKAVGGRDNEVALVCHSEVVPHVGGIAIDAHPGVHAVRPWSPVAGSVGTPRANVATMTAASAIRAYTSAKRALKYVTSSKQATRTLQSRPAPRDQAECCTQRIAGGGESTMCCSRRFDTPTECVVLLVAGT